jgi:hypothetical protein
VLIFERETELAKCLHTTIAITMSLARRHHRVHRPALECRPASRHPLLASQIHQSTHQFPHERDHLPALGVPATFAPLQCRVSDMSAPTSMVAHVLEHRVRDMEGAPGDLCLRHPYFLDQHRPRPQIPASILLMECLVRTRSVEAAGLSITHHAEVSDHL